jgi:general secretion pathway protein K
MRIEKQTAGRRERGGALLAVLWLSAALAAIGFSVATKVRTEADITSTHVDQLKAYYLATGAVDRAILWMQYGPGHKGDNGKSAFYEPGMSVLPMAFPGGMAMVEVMPESAKLNVNRATPEELGVLLVAMGVSPDRAQLVTAGILDWRSEAPALTGFDQFYLGLRPSFRARHASLEQIEELLYVRGVTPDLFYGSWARNAQGVLVRMPGLRDCLTVYGFNTAYDANTVPGPVMIAVGVPPDVAAQILARRAMRPFLSQEELNPFMGPAGGKLRLGGNSIYTLRATSTLSMNVSAEAMGLPLWTGAPAASTVRVNSDVRRSVAAVVKFNVDIKDDLTPYWILRWYDNAGTN